MKTYLALVFLSFNTFLNQPQITCFQSSLEHSCSVLPPTEAYYLQYCYRAFFQLSRAKPEGTRTAAALSTCPDSSKVLPACRFQPDRAFYHPFHCHALCLHHTRLLEGALWSLDYRNLNAFPRITWTANRFLTTPQVAGSILVCRKCVNLMFQDAHSLAAIRLQVPEE
jgi:hypothetical protein